MGKLLIILTLLLSQNSYSAIYDIFGNKIPDSEAPTARAAWRMLSFSEGEKWRGVQQIATETASCSGTLIDTGRNENEKSYFLTNGHCSHIDAMEISGEMVFQNIKTISAFAANYYFDSGGQEKIFKGNRLVYLTMNSTDIAIYELDHTIKDMKSGGFNFFKISPKAPKGNERVINVGLPLDHMTEETSYLHYSECKLLGLASIREHNWSMPYSLRHNCTAVGGMSGSPLINAKTLEIIGLVNTVVEDATANEPACSIGRPCEVSDQITVRPEFNYAQRVDKLALCFDETGEFDLNLPQCKLPK